MHCHFYSEYSDFENMFNFPKLEAHGIGSMAHPSWLVHEPHGYDEHADWEVVNDLFPIFLKEVNNWFLTRPENKFIEYVKLLRHEIVIGFSGKAVQNLDSCLECQ